MTVGKYTRVGSSKGPLTIGGAEKKMEEDSSFTYVPQFSVAGTLSEVDSWLKENHPSDAAKALQGSYNLKNLKKAGVRKAFVKELDGWQEFREQEQKRRQDERQINLMILVQLLKRYNDQRRSDGLIGEKKTGRKTLRDKLSEVIASGKVMDVTACQEKGKSITRVVLKNNSIKKRLVSDDSDPLHHVVYNPRVATASQGVAHFLTEYGGFTDTQITTIVESVSSNAEVSVKRTVTPSKARPSSPLTKRFSSPLRRNEESSVDDLLDDLAV